MSEKDAGESGMGEKRKSGIGILAEIFFSDDWQKENDAEVADAKEPKQGGRRKMTLRLSCRRHEDKVARFYDCGKPGDASFEQASRLLSPPSSDDKSPIVAFIKKNFEKPNVEILLFPFVEAGIEMANPDISSKVKASERLMAVACADAGWLFS